MDICNIFIIFDLRYTWIMASISQHQQAHALDTIMCKISGRLEHVNLTLYVPQFKPNDMFRPQISM